MFHFPVLSMVILVAARISSIVATVLRVKIVFSAAGARWCWDRALLAHGPRACSVT